MIYDKAGEKRNRDYIDWHFKLGRQYGIDFELKLAENFIAEKRKVMSALQTAYSKEHPSFAIVRTINPDLSLKLEQTGIPVFNSAFVSEICNHKGKTVDYITEHTSVPTIETKTFLNRQLTQKLLSEYSNCVIKAVDGHGGKQVFRTEEDWQDIQSGIGQSDFVIQPFVHGAGKDIRVYVVGREIVGAVERSAGDGFKANYSLGGNVKYYELNDEEAALVGQICRVFEFGMVGIDFLIDADGKWIFNEIEDVVGARMLYQCRPEVKLLERYFSFILTTCM